MERLRKHRIRVRSDYTYMSRAILAVEGTGKLLDPSFDMRDDLIGLAELLRDFSARLGRLLGWVEHGHISMTVDHRGLDRLSETLDNITNRITLGIIIGSLIIGSSMIITTGIELPV